MFNFLKKKLILVGSRHNLSDIIETANHSGYKIIGILDKHYWGNTAEICGIPVIGSEEELLVPNNKWSRYNFFPANWWDGKQALGQQFDADSLRRQRLQLLDAAGVTVVNLISKDVHWFHSKRKLTMGKGILILSNASVGSDVAIGDYSVIDWDTRIVDSTIGRNSIIGAASILAHVKVGDNVRIGVSSILIPSRKKDLLTVGDNAIVYIGSLVLDDVVENGIYTMHGKTRQRFKKSAN
jgi:bifunctional N-acetylglucosamine-1-phosphate-uridyltransferase/glucosamine-1-phosphate-acetyltransferase GlmU-like protein